MVGAGTRQAAQIGETEMIRVENVVERKTDNQIFGVKRRIESAPDARVEQAADFLKKSRRPRPRDIV